MPKGPGLEEARRALAQGGAWRVEHVREPYAATARFVEAPADVVLLSLARVRERDLAFVRLVRERSPLTRILLLVPEGRRRLAVEALRAGADAYVLEPCYAGELRAVLDRLCRVVPPQEGSAAEDQPSVGEIAHEVAHAIGNPLQVLSLLGDSLDADGGGQELGEVKETLRDETRRIHDVTRWLTRYGELGEPRLERVHLADLLQDSLEWGRRELEVEVKPFRPEPLPALDLDPAQIRIALRVLLRYLSARAGSGPLGLEARLEPGTTDGGRRAAHTSLRSESVRIEAEQLETDRRRLVWSSERSRAPHPGLAIPQRVAHGHGGRLLTRADAPGAGLALELPYRA